MRSGGNLSEVIGLILFIVITIPLLSTIFSSLSSKENTEIVELKKQNKILESQNTEKDAKILQLSSVLSSLNASLTEKDAKISNLTGQVNEKEREIQNITNELKYYKEKEYVKEVNNYFYNISNSLTNIENRFFPIEVYISLISISLLVVIFKVFGLGKFFHNIREKIEGRLNSRAEEKNEGKVPKKSSNQMEKSVSEQHVDEKIKKPHAQQNLSSKVDDANI